MASIFSRKRRDANSAPDPENRPEQRHDLLDNYLPASARPYEKQRLIAAYGTDDDADGPDEDIEFLESLVTEIDRQPFEEPKRLPPATIETVAAPVDEETKLNVFREMRDQPERARTSQQLGVRDVELDDLLEDLSTTAAAIRRRKAA
jgi:hypothetical protein